MLDTTKAATDVKDIPAPTLVILGSCDVPIWGLSAEERHRRAFRRAGVTAAASEAESLPAAGPVVLVRADFLMDENLSRHLVRRSGIILTNQDSGSGDKVAVAAHVDATQAIAVATMLGRKKLDEQEIAGLGLETLGPTDLASDYNEMLRKRVLPLALPLTRETLPTIEKRTFAAVYKGATDFVTKWWWPWPARHVTKWAAGRGITPNTITTLSLLLVFVTIYYFGAGDFLLGLAVAFLMVFLDTVDGKLARVTLTSSWWGNIYDHGIDLIHPPFWWIAWWFGLKGIAVPELAGYLEISLWVILVGYVIGRLMEGAFKLFFGIQTHIWQPIDYAFRHVTARRNPNLVILLVFTLVGRPDLGFIAVAVWTVLSLIFHAVRLVQAGLARARNEKVASWLAG